MVGHDPEGDAARYLGGYMSGVRRARYSEHLLACDRCWSEVAQAQEGRRLVEATRTVAPAHLRERMRAVAEAAQAADPVPAPVPRRPVCSPRRRVSQPLRRVPQPLRRVPQPWRRVSEPLLAAAAAAAVLLAGGTWGALALTGGDASALQEAVADYSARELPGTDLPAGGAPDLSALRLRPVGAGGGAYGGLEVDGYAYRDDAGRRIVLYLSSEPFPTARGAQPLSGPDGPWLVRRGDVVVLCARAPHALLVVGEDDQLVRSTALALGVM